MTNPKLTVFVGLPGSGKSTLAREILQREGSNGVSLNRDDLRTELFGDDYHKSNPVGKQETLVTKTLGERFERGMLEGKHLVDDNTNTNRRFLHKLLERARSFGAEIELVTVDVPIEEAKRRNRQRAAEGGRFVPEHVIDKMAESIYDARGVMKEILFNEKVTCFVDKVSPGSELVELFNRKAESLYPIEGNKIVALDFDGTLSFNAKALWENITSPELPKKNWDGFYASVSPVNSSVIELIRTFRAQGYSIFLFTGRQDSYATETIAALESYGAPISRLYMTREGDFRGDYAAKVSMLERVLAEGFEVVHSIDDRPSSIRVWEERGIPVSRVPEATRDNSGTFIEPIVVVSNS